MNRGVGGFVVFMGLVGGGQALLAALLQDRNDGRDARGVTDEERLSLAKQRARKFDLDAELRALRARHVGDDDTFDYVPLQRPPAEAEDADADDV